MLKLIQQRKEQKKSKAKSKNKHQLPEQSDRFFIGHIITTK